MTLTEFLTDGKPASETCQCHGIPLHELPKNHRAVHADGLTYDWWHPNGTLSIPPARYPSQVAYSDAIASPCELCEAPAGAECDDSKGFMFTLGTAVRDIGRVHAKRYLAAIPAGSPATRPR